MWPGLIKRKGSIYMLAFACVIITIFAQGAWAGPDYGGRLWFVYDKIRVKEVIHRNYKEAKFYNSGMG